MQLFQLNPQYEADFWEQGLRRPDDFLVCTDGVTVGQHASRIVRRIPFGEYLIFLKREQPVQWKDRLGSWLGGFGWVSKSQREWMVLHRLREFGLPCPEPLAMGEVGNMAFLVVRGYADAIDLPTYLAFRPTELERHQVMRNIGHAVADLHSAGFTHPDLYAKHVFVHRSTLQVSFVDFQRTVIKKNISWKQRCRELARLDATLHPGAVEIKERLSFLIAYLHRAYGHAPKDRIADASVRICAERDRLLCRRRIRAMYEETAQLAGNVSVVTYCRVRVPDVPSGRITTIDPPSELRRTQA
jgi:tRNA A-37 threonylcarbamoyl transferase component Bud32